MPSGSYHFAGTPDRSAPIGLVVLQMCSCWASYSEAVSPNQSRLNRWERIVAYVSFSTNGAVTAVQLFDSAKIGGQSYGTGELFTISYSEGAGAPIELRSKSDH